MTYKEQLDMNRIPQHVAIIMDGNGRWAEQRGKQRTEGHIKGVEVVRKIMENAVELGIKYLTLYTFSTENWNRPEQEVSALMGLLFKNIEEEVFIKNQVRFRVIGDIERLPAEIQAKLNKCMEHTRDFERSCMVLALSYSSRWEITRAARILADKAAKGLISADAIDEKMLSGVMTRRIPVVCRSQRIFCRPCNLLTTMSSSSKTLSLGLGTVVARLISPPKALVTLRTMGSTLSVRTRSCSG